ncbi:MAG: pilus assembly PilX N-terminal domain-containing protein [Acidobacteriota bacterium]|nr:pilus assembly PilX N-terminal domain-containing protein [Acidobacteriota bacterium]
MDPTARSGERGIALILALLMTLVLSALVASLAFVSQTETWSSQNYREMTQARYAAESGINKAANFLLNGYTAPSTTGTDLIAAYDVSVSPVVAVLNDQAVVLSARSDVTANYPVASVSTAFTGSAQGTLSAGRDSVGYAASARLLSMGQVTVVGATTPVTIQTWRLSSVGTIVNQPKAQVQVEATLEQQVVPAFNYAAFSTNNGCASLGFSGGGATDSYDSTAITYSGGKVVTQTYGGDIGSNGNLTSSGSTTTINGSLSTPRTGVGKCGSTITAWTSNGNSTVTGGTIELPQPVNYRTPDLPNPPPPTTSVSINSDTVLPPGSYGNIHVTSGAELHLSAGTYSLNSIELNGNATLVIDSGPVVLNVDGSGQSTPIDFSGGSVTNATMDPSLLQIDYAGTGTVKLTGNAQTAAVVYAPNAAIRFTGGTDWYGAVIAGTLDDAGGTAIHYDRHLKKSTLFTVGDYMLDSFTWKKY